MARYRRKKKGLRLETILIGALVIAFFIWALFKISIGEKIAQWMADDEPEEVVMPVDSLTMRLEELRPIYVTIDNLNLRTDPTLKSSVLKRLPLHERVYFTGVISDSTTQVNIGRVTTNEPWIKVILEDGSEGWLYGAGVQFYKTTNPNAFFN